MLDWRSLGRADLTVFKLGSEKADFPVPPNAFEDESGVIAGTGHGHDADRTAKLVDLVVVNGGPFTPELFCFPQSLVVGQWTFPIAHWKKAASFAVTLNCGMGSRFLNAVVNAF